MKKATSTRTGKLAAAHLAMRKTTARNAHALTAARTQHNASKPQHTKEIVASLAEFEEHIEQLQQNMTDIRSRAEADGVGGMIDMLMSELTALRNRASSNIATLGHIGGK